MLNAFNRSRRLLTAKGSCKLLNANIVIAKDKTSKASPRTAASKLTRGAKMPRCWVPNKPEQGLERATGQRYKLVSYNILAQDLLIEHLQLYERIDKLLLTWECRLHNLRMEITALSPDILCLQEMQFDHLENLVAEISGRRQLQYVFKKKTGHRTDGCAIIYDRSKFTLIEERAIEYYTPGEPLLNRDNVALLAKFHPTDDPTKVFVVATTHLLYNPRRDDVRIAQTQVLLKALATFSANNQNGDALPVLLTGDFNSTPLSPAFYALLTPTTPAKVPDPTANHQNQTCEKQKLNDEDSVQPCSTRPITECKEQPLQLVPISFGQSTASTFQEHWITVDYILHSVGSKRATVKIWGVYNLPTVAECQRVGRIPNRYLGSDHYSLAITFSL